MSYLVLARKYRPATFADVVGQEHVTRTLANAFAAGRVHHAFLFCGPRGCGKTTLARIVGKALNCENRAPHTAEPCGVCSACISISNGSAVDYQEMDGASNRGIDSIRELTEAVRYQPAMLKQKVYVIDEVHMLTTEAFNALLKTLEEPPPHVTFVLATTEPHKLPNTILSRCQRYDFKLVTAARLAQHLTKIFAAEQLPVAPAAISLIVRESGGSVRDALSLSDQIISYVGNAEITEAHVAEVLGVADRSLTRTLVHALATGDAGSALAAVESAIDRGVDEVQLARAVVRYLRDLSVLQAAPGRPQLVDATEEERADLIAEAGRLERTRVAQMFERMLRCCDDLGKTLQPRLVLDCALIDVATIEPLLPLGELIERLGELEAKIAKGGGRASAGGGGRSGARAPGADAPSPVPARPTQRAATPGSPQDPTPPGSPPPGSPKDPTPAPAPVIEPPKPTTPEIEPGPPPIPTGDPKPDPATVPQAVASAIAMAPSGPIPVAPSVASGSGPAITMKLAVPITPAETLAAWDTVLGALHERRKLSLLGMYEPARVLRWTATELELGFPVAMHATGEMASDTDKLEQLRAVLAELGHTVKITVRMLDAAESASGERRSILETSHANANAERIKREAEARGHGMIKQVLQTFGAQIKEIKTDV